MTFSFGPVRSITTITGGPYYLGPDALFSLIRFDIQNSREVTRNKVK